MNIRNRNFSFQDPECSNGDTFVSCNLTQLLPNTEICKDKKNLTFIDCNLVNCKLPQDITATSCNNTQVSKCTHIHPNLIKRGLTPCAEDCQHRIDDQKHWVEIDGGENGEGPQGQINPNRFIREHN